MIWRSPECAPTFDAHCNLGTVLEFGERAAYYWQEEPVWAAALSLAPAPAPSELRQGGRQKTFELFLLKRPSPPPIDCFSRLAERECEMKERNAGIKENCWETSERTGAVSKYPLIANSRPLVPHLDRTTKDTLKVLKTFFYEKSHLFNFLQLCLLLSTAYKNYLITIHDDPWWWLWW